MMWSINGEFYVFDNWEELGLALREVGRDGNDIIVRPGPICEECNGEGLITAFVNSSVPVYMECAECSAMGIKH